MKKFMLFMLAFVGLAMFSCLSEQSGAPTKPISKDGVLLKFTLPGGELITRSVAAVEGENIVNDMTVFFFEPTTNGTGKFIAAYKTPANVLPAPGAPEQSQFTFEIESMSGSGLVKTNSYSILVFANMKDNMFATDQELDNFIALMEGMSENEVMNQTTMYIKGVADDNVEMTGGIEIKNLPMSAQSKKEANVDVVDVQLIRTLSRFDVVNATSTHKIMSVSIWNGFTQSMVWEKGYMDYSQARTRRFYGRNFPAGKSMHGGLYSFENVSTTPDQNDTKTTCLILGIQPEGGGATKYYRINISPSESGQYLKRNNVYQLTVQKVLGEGEGSEIDAYVKGKILLDVSINSWDRDEDGLIIRDGNNLLAIPTRKARFSPEAEIRQYYVYTLGTGTLELIKLDMPAGIDAWLGGATNNDLFISVDAYTFDQRKGSIELRFAGMKGVIEIIQSGVTEKSLKLSHTTIPMYPAGTPTDMVGANPILINSSGAWTAEIYGNDFSFSMDSQLNILIGNDGKPINNIYSSRVNANQKSITNFVLITLDEDPDNYRNVLVLTQAGTGGFTLIPNNTTVEFNADMSLSQTTGNANVFKVVPGEATDTWIIEMSGTNADKFSVAVTDATSVSAGTWSGDGTITITANDTNYSGPYTAKMKITHNELNTKEINVTQDSYGLNAVRINTMTAIPETGGHREIRISTTASQPLEWKATLTGKPALVSKGLIPYFVGVDGKPIMDGAAYATSITGMTNATVKIGMQGINQDIRAEGAPEATMVAELVANPSVKTTPITINQDPVKYYNLYGQSTSTSYATWYGQNVHIANFKRHFVNASNFGPNGKVYAKSSLNVEGYSNITVNNNSGESKKRMFNLNGAPYISAANASSWTSFRNDPYVVWVLTTHLDEGGTSQIFNNVGFGGHGFKNIAAAVPVAYQRKITTDSKTVNSEIYKFLIGGDGPFGKVDAASINLRSSDAANGLLANGAWPATFIPLIMHESGCMLGIDPTLRIIWMGETEIFGDYYPANNQTPDALKFMNNLQAWMVMTANYGDAFNEKFKIKTP